jgi:hypothetical protein
MRTLKVLTVAGVIALAIGCSDSEKDLPDSGTPS